MLTLPGVAVGQHRKGHQHKGVRHRRLDILCGFHHTGVGAEGLQQVVLSPLRCKPLSHSGVQLRRRQHLGVRGRTQVRKHRRTGLCRRLYRQLPACIHQLFPAGGACRRHPGHPKGVGLDGVCPRCQIGTVHRQYSRRVGEVCVLAFLSRRCFIICTHAAIKEQRAFFQDLMHVFHVEVLLFSRIIRTLV